MPIPATRDKVHRMTKERFADDGFFDPKDLAPAFHDIWDAASEISFEGEDETVPETVQPDPEAGIISRRSSAIAEPFATLWGPELLTFTSAATIPGHY